jgi:hypothetical protein
MLSNVLICRLVRILLYSISESIRSRDRGILIFPSVYLILASARVINSKSRSLIAFVSDRDIGLKTTSCCAILTIRMYRKSVPPLLAPCLIPVPLRPAFPSMRAVAARSLRRNDSAVAPFASSTLTKYFTCFLPAVSLPQVGNDRPVGTPQAAALQTTFPNFSAFALPRPRGALVQSNMLCLQRYRVRTQPRLKEGGERASTGLTMRTTRYAAQPLVFHRTLYWAQA